MIDARITVKKPKDFYTTAEAAKLCGVSTMTIIRCFDAGKLKGFRVPGSRFRRIPRASLFAFMKENGIPLPLGETDGRLRMLIVEDDVDALRVMEKTFAESERFDVRTAADGFAAGFQVVSFKPDIVLLDIRLPGVNGREVCRLIRIEPSLAHTKVLAVTGITDKEKVAALFAAGIDDYLAKPFTVEVLRAKVEALLQGSRLKVADEV